MLLSSCFTYHDPEKKLLSDPYYEKPGDIFTWESNVTLHYSNSFTDTTTMVKTSHYSQTDEIPQKYNYSNETKPPYLKVSETEDNIEQRIIYADRFNIPIIDDDLEHFTSSDFTSYEGIAKPRDANPGDTFNYWENSDLFDSVNGLQVGYRTTELALALQEPVTLEVPAGTYQAVPVTMTLNITTEIDGILDTDSSTGTLWLEQDNGVLLRMVITEGVVTFTALGLTADYTLEWVLQSYTRADTSVANAVSLRPSSMADQLEPLMKQLSAGQWRPRSELTRRINPRRVYTPSP